MDNHIRSEVLITLNDGTQRTDTNLNSKQRIVKARTIGLELNDFQIYQSLPVQDKVAFLLEHGEDFNF